LNILFIMTDQQRVDYCSIYGRRPPDTPAMDRIGHEGAVFRKMFMQSAICGPSRACFYTGRYATTNRSVWNEVPLPITEKTAGHLFYEAGYRAAVIGKTHMYVDHPKPDFVKPECVSKDRQNLSRMDSAGFEYVAGSFGTPCVPCHGYIDYLNSKGYGIKNMRDLSDLYRPDESKQNRYKDYNRLPTRVSKEDDEAHYLTDRAIEFMRETKDKSWFLHLSYYRPHHPNWAAYPYNEMYDENDFPPPAHAEEELDHPLFKEFRNERNANPTKGDPGDDLHCRHWRAVYAGLIKEIDDNLNRLFAFMETEGLMDNTLIIFTSDHGEFAGDHWFFEKEMCHRQSYHAPLLIRHPKLAGGVINDDYVESVDILPTCLEAAGLAVHPGIQGRSLLPLMRGERPTDWRSETFAEWTFEYYTCVDALKLPREKCRAILMRNDDFSYCHFNGLPDLLFDLRKDPDELRNVADDPAYARVKNELKERMLDWTLATWDPLPVRVETGWPKNFGRGTPAEYMPYNAGRFMPDDPIATYPDNHL